MKRLGSIAATVFAYLLLSCGGGDGGSSITPPAETGQTVLIEVTTTGTDIDPDGYTVRLGTRTATVEATGTATFDDVPPGTYEVQLEGIAGNCTVQGGETSSVSVTSASGGQVSFSVECTLDFGDGLPTVACEGLSLVATSGMPMDRIAAGSVPSTLSPPFAARVVAADGNASGFAWFEADEETGQVEMVTPLHPSAELEGGDVQIRATDGNVACAPFDFAIEPLSASPGELGAVLDQLQDVLRTQAAVLQTTPEELMATPLEQVGDMLLPLAIVQYVLDHPENPESLRRFADETGPEDVPLDLIEALLARVGIRGALGKQLSAPRGAPQATVTPIDPDDCTPEAVGADTQRLSDCMNAERAVARLLVDLAEEVGPRLAAAITLAVAVPAAEESVQDVLAGLGWLAIQQEVATSAQLPCCASGELEVDPARFMEDEDRVGAWSYQIIAGNSGWDIRAGHLELLFIEAAVRGLQKVGVKGVDVQNKVFGLLDGKVKERLPDLEIPLQQFGPVPVDQEEWSDVTYEAASGTGRSVEGVEHTSYKPVGVGETRLFVVTRPKDQDGETRFGGQTFTGLHSIHVDSILIRVEPEDTVLAPGRTATFRVTVENSQFPQQVEKGAAEGTMLQGVLSDLEFTGENTANLPYAAPPNPDFDDPDEIEVRSTSMTGARAAENAPPRFGTATIRFGEVVITPGDLLCLGLSGEIAFTAEVKGPDDQSVTWTADEGTIDQDGTYVAPPEKPASGTATVRATSNAYPDLFDEVTFSIGCACNYGFTLGDVTVVPESGDVLSFTTARENPTDQTEAQRLISVSVRRPGKPWSAFLHPPDTEVSSRPDGVGTWPMAAQGDMGLSPPDVHWGADVLLDLEVYEPISSKTPGVARLAGSIDGATAHVVSTELPTTAVPFEWWFVIVLQGGQLQCTVP